MYVYLSISHILRWLADGVWHHVIKWLWFLHQTTIRCWRDTNNHNYEIKGSVWFIGALTLFTRFLWSCYFTVIDNLRLEVISEHDSHLPANGGIFCWNWGLFWKAFLFFQSVAASYGTQLSEHIDIIVSLQKEPGCHDKSKFILYRQTRNCLKLPAVGSPLYLRKKDLKAYKRQTLSQVVLCMFPQDVNWVS